MLTIALHESHPFEIVTLYIPGVFVIDVHFMNSSRSTLMLVFIGGCHVCFYLSLQRDYCYLTFVHVVGSLFQFSVAYVI